MYEDWLAANQVYIVGAFWLASIVSGLTKKPLHGVMYVFTVIFAVTSLGAFLLVTTGYFVGMFVADLVASARK